MTFAAAQFGSELGHRETLGFLKGGYIHEAKFGYFEPPVNRKVRNSRNDLCYHSGDNSDMPKSKSQEHRWYVKEWLAHKNLRQKDLVARTDWNKSQINEWVNEKERWNRDVLFAFANAIGVEPADLLRRPPVGPIDDEFYVFMQQLEPDEKAKVLRLWEAAGGALGTAGKKVA